MEPIVVPIAYAEPREVFAPFAEAPYALLLESTLVADPYGRHAFIALDPYRIIEGDGGRTQVDGRVRAGYPLDVLKSELEAISLDTVPGLPPFQGGAAGCFGYGLAHDLEAVPMTGKNRLAPPDLAIGLYDVVIAFDLIDKRAWIISSGLPETVAGRREQRASERAYEIRDLLQRAPQPLLTPVDGPLRSTHGWQADFAPDDYRSAIQRVIDYIWDGDIFQANLAQRFANTLAAEVAVYDLYRRLSLLSPAPFAGYLWTGSGAIVSSSPERFLSVNIDGQVQTRPIKGTRPRGASEAEDAASRADLEASEKDRAENVMIVDLLRNDLSRVCRDHSVDAPELCAVESYATVHHLVSTVVGELAPGHGRADLVKACFPGGSITGAPKVRAMEIIAELEPVERGPYCGSLGYIGFDGAMDTNILIRTMTVRDREVSFHVGGGIVADSDADAEYEETLTKGRALFATLEAPYRGGGAS